MISWYYLIQMYWRLQIRSLAQFLRKMSFMCSYSLAVYAKKIGFELKLQFTVSLKFHIILKAIPSTFWLILWSSTEWEKQMYLYYQTLNLRQKCWGVESFWSSLSRNEGGEGHYHTEIKLLDNDAFKQKMKTTPVKLRDLGILIKTHFCNRFPELIGIAVQIQYRHQMLHIPLSPPSREQHRLSFRSNFGW